MLLVGATACEQLLPVADGSARVLCGLDNPDGNPRPALAFAFDSSGRSVAGWPVDLRASSLMDGPDRSASGRVVGDELTLFTGVIEADTAPATFVGALVTVAGDGALRVGDRVTMGYSCCDHVLGIGPDGVGYDVDPGAASADGTDTPSAITALDLSGVRAGWPVSIDGIASAPAFGPRGRIVLTVASSVRRTSRVLVFDREGEAVSAGSAELPIATVDENTGETGGCGVGSPQAPLVAHDGTIFVYSEIDTEIQALDPSLGIMSGWPFKPDAPLERARPGYESEHEAGYCPPPVPPAVGPDSTLYLPLQAADATAGGSIVAIGPDGRVRPGWPVELRRPAAEFWSVVVGPDGTVYAMAIEPESGDTSSASIIAVAPDSTVRWTTTIIDP